MFHSDVRYLFGYRGSLNGIRALGKQAIISLILFIMLARCLEYSFCSSWVLKSMERYVVVDCLRCCIAIANLKALSQGIISEWGKQSVLLPQLFCS